VELQGLDPSLVQILKLNSIPALVQEQLPVVGTSAALAGVAAGHHEAYGSIPGGKLTLGLSLTLIELPTPKTAQSIKRPLCFRLEARKEKPGKTVASLPRILVHYYLASIQYFAVLLRATFLALHGS
jgi:hypothetical protein